MRKATELVTKPIAVVVLLALLGVTAHAGAILIFTSRDAYLAFVGPPDFEFNLNNLPSTRAGAVNFDPVGQMTGDLIVREGALEFLANPTARAAINISPGFGVTAWGAEINPLGGPGQIGFTSGRLGNLINISGPGWVGFVSTVPLRRFNINFVALEPLRTDIGLSETPSTNFVLDNVIVNVVPEPTTLLLFASGAGLIGWARRRRTRAARREQHSSDGEQA